MPLKSRFTAPIPNVSLPTYLFTSPSAPLPTSPPIYLDTESPITECISLSAYRLFSQRLASGLRTRGLQSGERVMLFSGNNIFFPVVIMGVIMSGGIFTGANPSYSSRELAHQLQDADCRFMLTSPAGSETALQAADAVGMPRNNIYIFNTAGVLHRGRRLDETTTTHSLPHWTTLLSNPQTARTFAWAEFKTEDQCHEIAALNYSSGTTGLSKGVTISHRNFVSNAVQLINLEEQDPAEPRKRASIRLLACLPMYHAMGQCIFVTMAPKRRTPTYVMRKFDFLKFLACVERYRITELTVVPPIAVQLARRPETKHFDLGTVETIASGAAPLSKEICAQLEALWPERKLTVKQGWGMTECTCGILGFHPLEEPIAGSVGELTANCEAKVMGEDGVMECARGEKGEIWVRAPNITNGYWRNESATTNTITKEGWLKTGDVGFVDEEGKWFVVDRMKELIKAKGHQVAPAELEGLLLDHPAVQDAAVIGVVLADAEEHPRAYIVPAAAAPFHDSSSTSGTVSGTVTSRSGDGISTSKHTVDANISPLLADILESTNKKLAPFKRITGGIVSVDAIPKNPSGKLLRKQLRERAKRELQVGRSML